MSEPRRTDDAEPIADAASVFDSAEIRAFKAPAPGPAEAEPEAEGEYDLVVDPYASAGPMDPAPPIPIDPDPLPMTGQRAGKRPRAELEPASRPEPEPEPEPEPPPPPRAEIRTRPKPKVKPPADEDSNLDDEAEAEASEVDPVWSRWGEWGPDLIRVGLAGLAALFLLWLASGSLRGMALVVLLGGAAMGLLCYPMMITLERPVRITPEQAITDFFAAASHHFPHYRRMWLLLSKAGRASGPFRDFDHFRSHWRGRIDSWKQGKAGKYAPLRFEVVDFQAKKSSGLTATNASYTVHVYVRDQDAAGPVASYKMAHGLAKGDDRMWYLNRGTLPAGRK